MSKDEYASFQTNEWNELKSSKRNDKGSDGKMAVTKKGDGIEAIALNR
jgi:hypothetical protein